MYDRFTDRARRVMQLANQEAQRLSDECVTCGHVLIGMVKEGGGIGAIVLRNAGVELRKLRVELEKLAKPGQKTVAMGRLSQTPAVKRAIDYAIEEARNLNHKYVGTEHLLLGLTRDGTLDSMIILAALGIDTRDLRKAIVDRLQCVTSGSVDSEGDAVRDALLRMVGKIREETAAMEKAIVLNNAVVKRIVEIAGVEEDVL